MIVNFLTSNKILAKSFSPTEKKPYPLVSKFTSHTHTISTIEEFFTHIVFYANAGGCLLKGTLTTALKNESRAGSTVADLPTEYSVFDIDRCNPLITTPDEFIKNCLPECFQNVSYIWQVSNSAKITKNCLAGHLFFLHEHPINAKILKQIYTALNFESTDLSNELRLSHNGQTLSFGLDPTTAQNDKLIFIAHPVLTNIKDPFSQRIFLTKREKPSVNLNPDNFNITTTNTNIHNKINELRLEAGLPRKNAKTKADNGITVLCNPERAIFRGPYITERGFVYGNLNNGDSYAYFHTEENPKYLYNFKGEPAVKLQDIDPDYWNSLHQAVKTNHRYFAFRDRVSDVYYTVIEHGDTYDMHRVGNLQKAEDFLSFYHQEVPETIPIWDIVFQPNRDFLIDHENRLINTYQKTEFLKKAVPSTHYPHKFMELINHVTGNDAEMRDDLLNWLAYIVQYREKAQTAFILQGRTGTGKGVLFNKILRPIIGLNHCAMIMMEDIDSNFNEWLENAILVVVDEAEINDDPKRAKKRMNKIKNLITEPISQLRIKFVSNIQRENHVNFIFTSNEYDSVRLNVDDRRFKVAPRQEAKLEYNKKDVDLIEASVQDVANYLIGYPVDIDKVRNIIYNQARAQLIEASQNSVDEFIEIIKTGNLDKLLSYNGEFALSVHEAYKSRFEDLLNTWQHGIGLTQFIPTADLRVAYNYLFNTDISFVKFGKVLSTKSIRVFPKRINDKVLRCVAVNWTSTILNNKEGQPIPCGHSVN